MSTDLVNNNCIFLQDVILVKSGGPLGLSIIGGSDHSCVPFGIGESGIFISKVNAVHISLRKRILFKCAQFNSYAYCSAPPHLVSPIVTPFNVYALLRCEAASKHCFCLQVLR